MDESSTDPTFAPEATADTPVTDDGAPVEQGHGAEQVDHFDEKFDRSSLPPELLPAYNEMHGNFTQKSQTLAEERKAIEDARAEHQQAIELFEAIAQDPNAGIEEIRQLFELAGDEDEYADGDEYSDDDPTTQLAQRLEQLESERAQEREQRQMYQSLNTGVEQINELRGKAGEPQITSDELEEILGFVGPPDRNGNVPVFETYKRLNGYFDGRQQKYLAGKRAPTPPGAGSQGSEKFDITNRDSRIERLKAVLDGQHQ